MITLYKAPRIINNLVGMCWLSQNLIRNKDCTVKVVETRIFLKRVLHTGQDYRKECVCA